MIVPCDRDRENLQLQLTQKAEAELWHNISRGDRLILEEIFNIRRHPVLK